MTDGLYQTPTLPGVLPATRRVGPRARHRRRRRAPGLVGLGARGMADLLADRMLATRSGRVLVDDLGHGLPRQRGRRPGGGARHPRPPGASPAGVHFSVPNAASLLTDPAMAGARTAAMRAGRRLDGHDALDPGGLADVAVGDGLPAGDRRQRPRAART